MKRLAHAGKTAGLGMVLVLLPLACIGPVQDYLEDRRQFREVVQPVVGSASRPFCDGGMFSIASAPHEGGHLVLVQCQGEITKWSDYFAFYVRDRTPSALNDSALDAMQSPAPCDFEMIEAEVHALVSANSVEAGYGPLPTPPDES